MNGKHLAVVGGLAVALGVAFGLLLYNSRQAGQENWAEDTIRVEVLAIYLEADFPDYMVVSLQAEGDSRVHLYNSPYMRVYDQDENTIHFYDIHPGDIVDVTFSGLIMDIYPPVMHDVRVIQLVS